MSAQEIQRELRISGCVVPAMVAAADSSVLYLRIDRVPGRERTAYFYRKMAITFAQNARRKYLEILFPGYIETHRSLAKSYLKSYRQLKGLLPA